MIQIKTYKDYTNPVVPTYSEKTWQIEALTLIRGAIVQAGLRDSCDVNKYAQIIDPDIISILHGTPYANMDITGPCMAVAYTLHSISSTYIQCGYNDNVISIRLDHAGTWAKFVEEFKEL
mgnify:FL=1|jgi:hypothetical protein